MVPKRRKSRDARDTATRYKEANDDFDWISSPTFNESPLASMSSYANDTALRKNGAPSTLEESSPMSSTAISMRQSRLPSHRDRIGSPLASMSLYANGIARRKNGLPSTLAGSSPMSSTSISFPRSRLSSHRDRSLVPTVEEETPPSMRRSVREAMDRCAVHPIDLWIGDHRPRGTKRSAAVAAHVDDAPSEDRVEGSEPGPLGLTPVGRRTTRSTFRSSLELRPPQRLRVSNNLETAGVAPEERWVAVGEDRCKPCKLVGREVCKPQWNTTESCKSCEFCTGGAWSCNPPDSWLEKVATTLHPNERSRKPMKVATEDARIGVSGSSEAAEAGPPTTKAKVTKRQSGHQKDGEVAQADLNNDARLLRIEDRLSSIERHGEGLTAIQSTQQEMKAMLLALCCHQGVTPLPHSGFSASAPASAPTHSVVPSPVTKSSDHSLVLKRARANSYVEHEDEGSSENIGGPSSVSSDSAYVDTGRSADVQAEAPPEPPVEEERTQGSVKVTSALTRESNRIGTVLATSHQRSYRQTRKLPANHLRLEADAPQAPSGSPVEDERTQGSAKKKVNEAKQILSTLIQEMEGVRIGMKKIEGRLSEVSGNMQDIRLLLEQVFE